MFELWQPEQIDVMVIDDLGIGNVNIDLGGGGIGGLRALGPGRRPARRPYRQGEQRTHRQTTQNHMLHLSAIDLPPRHD